MTAGVTAFDLVAEQSPLGGLQRWLFDPDVDEVLVNRGGEIWIDRRGRLERVGSMRTSTLRAVIEHLLAPTGRRVDRTHPTVDARLADGARLCAVIEPVAVDGPCLAVRRPPTRRFPLAAFGPRDAEELLLALVERRLNILVSGATSSGKTSVLTALAGHAAPTERLVVLEDTAELCLDHPHVVRLECRDATPDGVGRLTMDDLLRTALRLRPDRLVVGEVRGSEATPLLQALNTGHDGSLATVHANSATDAVARLTTLVLQATSNWPMTAVEDHLIRAVDAIVHVERRRDGSRRVVEIAEVDRSSTGRPSLRLLYEGGAVSAELHRTRA